MELQVGVICASAAVVFVDFGFVGVLFGGKWKRRVRELVRKRVLIISPSDKNLAAQEKAPALPWNRKETAPGKVLYVSSTRLVHSQFERNIELCIYEVDRTRGSWGP